MNPCDNVLSSIQPKVWNKVSAVLDDYISFACARLLCQADMVREALDTWIATRHESEERSRLEGRAFNPLTLVKLGETAHSRLIGNLLHPQGSHGQRTLFLERLLRLLDLEDPAQGSWQVTVETGRIDILLWRHEPKSAVIIENKANDAVDQANQIYRYWHKEIFLWDREIWMSKQEADIQKRRRRFHIVYLTSGEERTPTEQSLTRPVGWERVNPFDKVPLEPFCLPLADLMNLWEKEAVPTIPESNHPLRIFLSQYQQLWKK